jgi:hypothetical protein
MAPYYDSDPMSSSPPPSSPLGSEKDIDVFGPLSPPPAAAHSTPIRPKKTNQRLYSGIDESSNPANPVSAFYEHPQTRLSLQQAPPPQAYGLDLEKGLSVPAKEPEHHLSSYSSRTQLTASSRNASITEIDTNSKSLATLDSAVWPSKKELEVKAREEKRMECRKKWNFYGTLNKKQKLYVQILVGLVVVAAAVGVGVGISRAVGGGVYKQDGQTSAIGG